MAIHKPLDQYFVTLDGKTLTSGGSFGLAKGVIGVFNHRKSSAQGAVAESTITKRDQYVIKQGKFNVPSTRSAQNAKPYSSIPFFIKNVEDVYVSAPKSRKQKFDTFNIGYDGINTSTALTFEPGDNTVLDIALMDGAIAHLGYKDGKVLLKFHVDVALDDTRTNQEIVQDLVKRIKETKLINNVPLTDVIEVKIIDSSRKTLTGVSSTFSTLQLKDLGDSNDLARVQAQYPLYKVERTDRSGATSTYTILTPTSALPLTAYTETIPSVIKECEDCLAGYSALTAGFVYYVTINDDGADVSTTVDNLPGFVTGTVNKVKGVNNIGYYTVVVNDELTQGEIDTFVTANPTATVDLLGDVKSVCENTSTTTYSWVAGDVCYTTSEVYTIQLPDTDCGASRLSELQSYYSDLTVVEGDATGKATQTITLTGTSGTANISIGGVNYLATFDTDLTTTATNFVSTHAATILTATGATITSNAAVITINDDNLEFPSVSITNVSGDLAGTVGSKTLIAPANEGGCQRIYSTTVVTDLSCEDCDPIYHQIFTSEAPYDFEFSSWELYKASGDSNALMGIRIEALPFILAGDEATIDEIPFYETSASIEVAGGYLTDVNESFNKFEKIFNVKLIERKQDRDHLGYNFRIMEDMSKVYFDGEPRHVGNNFAKVILGEDSLLKPRAQYVDYAITIRDDKYAQANSGRQDTAITYHVLAEVGYHTDVENMVNKIAVAANLDPVQAFANN